MARDRVKRKEICVLYERRQALKRNKNMCTDKGVGYTVKCDPPLTERRRFRTRVGEWERANYDDLSYTQTRIHVCILYEREGGLIALTLLRRSSTRQSS